MHLHDRKLLGIQGSSASLKFGGLEFRAFGLRCWLRAWGNLGFLGLRVKIRGSVVGRFECMFFCGDEGGRSV